MGVARVKQRKNNRTYSALLQSLPQINFCAWRETGPAKNSAAADCSKIFPWSINTISSASLLACVRSWVVMIILAPDCLKLSIILSKPSTEGGSSATVGSSSKITAGCSTQAQARESFCISPPDNKWALRWLSASSPQISSACWQRRRCSRLGIAASCKTKAML